eukprot:2777829-Rhodomonas_salina.1
MLEGFTSQWNTCVHPRSQNRTQVCTAVEHLCAPPPPCVNRNTPVSTLTEHLLRGCAVSGQRIQHRCALQWHTRVHSFT